MTAREPRRLSVRFALVAMVCLLLGAATTIGTAWTLANPSRFREMYWKGTRPGASRNMIAARNVHPIEVTGGLIWWEVRSPEDWTSVLVAGWPFFSLQSRTGTLSRAGAEPPWTWLSWRDGINPPRSWEWKSGGALPVQPLFPGFAIDTALYAMAWYLLIFTPLPLIRAGRRRSRVSRGMCPACAYDLKGSPSGPCPECGRAPAKSS